LFGFLPAFAGNTKRRRLSLSPSFFDGIGGAAERYIGAALIGLKRHRT
jgi:hypothetical protein